MHFCLSMDMLEAVRRDYTQLTADLVSSNSGLPDGKYLCRNMSDPLKMLRNFIIRLGWFGNPVLR